MASTQDSMETITADPVIVEISDAETSERNSQQEPAVNLDSRSRPRSLSPDAPKHKSLGRRSSIVEFCHPRQDHGSPNNCCMVIENSKSLEAILYGTDVYAQLPHQGFQMTYITSHSLHPIDVEKVSWLLTMGVPDAWVQQVPQAHPIVRGPVYELPQGRRRYHPAEPMYPEFGREGPAIAFIRLGAALRVFDENHLLYSRHQISHRGGEQAALTIIVHEILCDNSISFVGAVLCNAPIPACITGGAPKMRFEWAADLDDMDIVSHDIIRVLC